jgi:hypothetical protein
MVNPSDFLVTYMVNPSDRIFFRFLEEILQVAIPKNGRVPSVEKVTKRMLQLKCALGLFFQFTSFKEDPFAKIIKNIKNQH